MIPPGGSEGSLREPRVGRALLQQFLAAIRNRSLYPPDHPEVIAPIQLFVDALSQLDEPGGTTLAIIEGEAYLNGAPLREASLQYAEFLQFLAARGVQVLHFAVDVRTADIGALIDILARDADAIQRAGGAGALLEAEGLTHVRADALVGVSDRRFHVAEEPRGGSMSVSDADDTEPRHPLEPLPGLQRSYAGCVDTMQVVLGGGHGEARLDGGMLTNLAERLVSELLNDPGAFLGLLHIRTVGEDVFQHAVNVAILAVLLGSKLEMDADQLRTLGIGALLHDVGELYIPRELRDKPGCLTEAEWEIVRQHPARGAKLILGTGGLDPVVATIALEHHVEFQGGGYPKMRSRQRPHLYSRIVAIADAYDAMTHPRPYQSGTATCIPPQRILECSGAIFDPTLVKILLHSVGFYPPGTPVRLSDGRPGVVESHAPGQPFLPRVLVQGEQGYHIVDTAEFDAAGRPMVTVDAVLGRADIPARTAIGRLESSR